MHIGTGYRHPQTDYVSKVYWLIRVFEEKLLVFRYRRIPTESKLVFQFDRVYVIEFAKPVGENKIFV
ncbi:hypothetical protein HvAV-3i_gp172 [Heliothis virescens ascovirus 3i]|nr:hypothetical protein HvAV-3i_gp172 [Heliothis virescens ascovirus 3i]